MKHLVAVERTSDVEITVTRQFNGPARLVFRAWSEPELFRQWWVPPSFGMTLLAHRPIQSSASLEKGLPSIAAAFRSSPPTDWIG